MSTTSSSAGGGKSPKISRVAGAPMIPPSSYWVTPPGRNLVAVFTAACSGVYFGGHTFVHSWLLNKYQDTVHLYKNGFPTPLSSEVKVRCQRTVDDLSLPLKNPNMVRFFCVFGMDVFHAGSLKLREGSIIGVPRNFSYTRPEEIEKNDIVVENKPIEWGSDGGQLLQEALILSDRAQKFGIAREIVMTDNHAPYVHGGLGAAAITAYYMITRGINDRLHGLARPRSFRMLAYSLVGTFTFGVWATVTDMITKHYENQADETVGRMGLEYAKGGIEFYSKTLQRNMALRSLMGPSGEKLFTFYGNDVEFIRQKHVPYTERKRNLETIAEKLQGMLNSVSTSEEILENS